MLKRVFWISFEVTYIKTGFDLPHHTWSTGSFPDRSWSTSCKSAQTWPCQLSCLWVCPTANHESHCQHVLINQIWRQRQIASCIVSSREDWGWRCRRHSHMLRYKKQIRDEDGKVMKDDGNAKHCHIITLDNSMKISITEQEARITNTQSHDITTWMCSWMTSLNWNKTEKQCYCVTNSEFTFTVNIMRLIFPVIFEYTVLPQEPWTLSYQAAVLSLHFASQCVLKCDYYYYYNHKLQYKQS